MTASLLFPNELYRTSLPDDQMTRFIFSGMMLCVVSVGCTPWTTRYPTVMMSEPRSERREFQRHDPFTVTDMGPDTMVRPRDYAVPRTRERADAEEKFRRGFGGQGAARPAFPAYGMPPQPLPMGY